ncbi:RAQPRD family integrative conjugative element protein [Actinobacillus porcinus]|uniref:Integrative conjugative element protein, RAQPRD family n=1 Tax=[Actinobacillus] rossii TaxID=123820 RepID=A0A380U2K2_9PAST|nr:RAQPRD family integrative conjugative element protein [Actinobacillus porcinus]MDY3123646.1 RAQPRD family integrative conjugative element protein [[Actinobacillus] rossii]MDY4506077.1 RAQPRD family integrative conjugative element protein [[Actinobacillus] rossii]MDY6215182.1 RAQPRD family integrative conjugative element protein [Actinobacillus porcinus]SUT95382.1 integrative conjugative element protein, RAQPRD family [[Actinobacillus] rossii]
MFAKKHLGKWIVIVLASSSMTAYASTEKEQLAQAIKQLEAAELSLKRAEQLAKTSPKTREFFNYEAIRHDMNIVKRGITQYINPARAMPRDPKALRTLTEDYTKLRGQ